MKFLLFSCLLLGSLGLTAQDSLAKAAVPALLQTLHDTLVMFHPIGPSAEGRQSIGTGLKRARTNLTRYAEEPGDSISFLDFFRLSRPFQEELGDGHLTLHRELTTAQRDSLSHRSHPLPLFLTTDRGYVSLYRFAVAPGDTIRARTQVLSVDGRATEEWVDDLSAWRGLNDAGDQIGARYRTALGFPYYLQQMTRYRDSLRLEIADSTGNQRTVYFKTRTPEPPATRKNGQTKKAKKMRKRRPAPGVWSVRRVDSSDVWVLDVSSFNHDRLNKPNFKKLVRQAIDTLRENNVNRLILDLRQNPGGRIKYAATLLRALNAEPIYPTRDFISYSPNGNGDTRLGSVFYWLRGIRKRDGVYRKKYLTKPEKPFREERRYTGDLAVLIDQGTFSASGIVANQLQATGRATLIGRPTANSASTSFGGHKYEYQFGPRGALKLTMMNYRLTLDPPRPGTIQPDIHIPIKRDMLVNGVDNTLNFARDYLLNE